jgi:hypothetical protein
MNDAAIGFEKVRESLRTPHSLLVGMGDNFAPQLEARTFETEKTPFEGKDLFVWNGTEWLFKEDTEPRPYDPAIDIIPADNVGCFILKMGYAALVPGKHDFYFGPDYLRMMAKFLYQDPATGTALLAANLSISTAAPDAKPRQPLYMIEHDLNAHGKRAYTVLPPLHKDDPSPTIAFPDVVMPWYRKVAVDNAFYLTEKAGQTRVNPADLTEKYRMIPVPGKMIPAQSNLFWAADGGTHKEVDVELRVDGLKLCLAAPGKPYELPDPTSGCDELKVTEKASGDDFKTGRITFEIDGPLKANQNYAACMHLVRGKFDGNLSEYYCQPFYVAQPFFTYGRGPGQRDDDPFILKDLESEKVAIFGLLDPDLQGRIGRLNYGWYNQNTKYETTAQISGLQDALKQAIARCEQVDACRTATRKILLAQMPAAKTSQFLAGFSEAVFDLAVAETDSANQTPGGTIVEELPDSSTNPRFVVVPGEIYSGGKLSYQIRKATVGERKLPPVSLGPDACRSVWDDCPENASKPRTWTLVNRAIANPECYRIPAGKFAGDNLRSMAIQTLTKIGVEAKAADGSNEGNELRMNRDWSSSQILQRLALLVMQKYRHADISLLQSRDMFQPEIYGATQITSQNLQEILDRLFWKGDYAVTIPVTGATLAAIQQASTDFATLDANPVNVDLAKGRSLATLGLFKEAADKNWTVNGSIVDPAKVYSVTMTDYLALGDTGYSQLKTPLVPNPYRIKDFRELTSISGLVCSVIKGAIAGMNAAECHDGIASHKSKDYMDISSYKPADSDKGLTALQQSKSYLNPRFRWIRFQYFYKSQNAAEVASAQKRYWSFELEKSDFGLNANIHKHFTTIDPASPPIQTASLNNEFAGITVAPVTAPSAYAVSFDDRWRLKYSTSRVDFFLLHESAYSYTRTQDKSDNSWARNLSQNMWDQEMGTLLRFWPRHRRPREWDILLSGRAESQVLAPREDIALAKGAISSSLHRSFDLYGKFGARFSDERSWFEMGYLNGRSLENPSQIVFNDANHDAVNLIPGCNQCAASGGVTSRPAPNAPFLDWISYLSTSQTNLDGSKALPQIDSNTKFSAIYVSRPLSGFFANFSVNIPLPIAKYPDWAGGKPIAWLMENNGRWFFNNKGDLATQTKYYDKLAFSLVVPVVGNLTLKPEVDFVFYRNKVAEIPFRSTTYMGTLSYTFSWRQGQPLSRVWRYASPPPTASVPNSGR